MSWIKRNLYFLIGSVVALVLLGLAGFYLYSKWDANNQALEKLNQSYEDLKKLNAQNPHPGSGNINNIETAREQIKELKTALEKTKPYFERMQRIPDLPKMTDFDFSTALAQTIAQLTRDAAKSSVSIPTNYSFSFQAQRNKMGFAANSLAPLSVQLGEVKAICEILFAAKVNTLDYIRRERVSPDDSAGSQGDYLAEKSITNALAIITPYEISFHGFSPELAAVLSGLSNSRFGLIAQFVNVEVAPAVASMEPTPGVANPVYIPPPVTLPTPSSESAAFQQRYGIGGGANDAFRRRYGLGVGKDGAAPPPVAQPVTPTYAVAPRPAAAGLPTVIDEKQLKVTLMINIVKMVPPPK